MNKNNHNQKHLTLSDRVYIEQELLQGSTFRSIASVLHKDPSTISKEIRLHASMPKAASFKTPRCKQCRYYDSCKMSSLCKISSCRQICWSCDYNRYAMECKKYDPFKCPKLHKPPYVCNNCETRQTCHNCKRYYHAIDAQHTYERTLYDSRKGINLTPEELQKLNDLISPLVLKGQPLSHILLYMQLKYQYVDGLFTIILTKVSLKFVTLTYLVVFATRSVKNALNLAKKTINKHTVTNEPMLILSVLWQLIQMLMSLKWIL